MNFFQKIYLTEMIQIGIPSYNGRTDGAGLKLEQQGLKKSEQ